jgi:hypothetical protein
VSFSYLCKLLPFLRNNELVSLGWSFDHGAATRVYMKNANFQKDQQDIHTVANSLVFILQVKSVLYAFTFDSLGTEIVLSQDLGHTRLIEYLTDRMTLWNAWTIGCAQMYRIDMPQHRYVFC